MIQVIQLQGKDKQLYRFLAPMVMDPVVIRANNNYPFKTGENFVWYITIEDKEVIGFVPIEQKSGKRALLNNYYIKADGEKREAILTLLLDTIIAEYSSEGWRLSSVTLVQDKEIFEKHQFVSLDKKWTRYVKMTR